MRVGERVGSRGGGIDIREEFQQGRTVPRIALKALRSCSTRSAARLLVLVDNNRDLALVGGISDSIPVKKQAFPRVERQAGGARGAHDIDSLDADDRHIEAHILIGLGDLHNRKSTAESGGIAFEGTHDLAGTLDGGVGAFHGLDGHAGGLGDNDGLADIVVGEVARDGAAVVRCSFFLLRWARVPSARRASRAAVREMKSNSSSMDAFVSENLGDRAEQSESVLRVAKRKQKLGETPVGLDAGENLLVLDLSGHDGAGDAFSLEGLDELGELAEREPVDGRGAALFDFRIGLFLDGGDNDVDPLGASRVNDQEGETCRCRQ